MQDLLKLTTTSHQLFGGTAEYDRFIHWYDHYRSDPTVTRVSLIIIITNFPLIKSKNLFCIRAFPPQRVSILFNIPFTNRHNNRNGLVNPTTHSLNNTIVTTFATN